MSQEFLSNFKYVSVPVTDVKVGDILSVNTGHRILDDEDCEVLEVKDTEGLFGDPQKSFWIKSVHGNHWYDCPLTLGYGEKTVPCKVTKLAHQ